jgi:hypothetical protein
MCSGLVVWFSGRLLALYFQGSGFDSSHWNKKIQVFLLVIVSLVEILMFTFKHKNPIYDKAMYSKLRYIYNIMLTTLNKEKGQLQCAYAYQSIYYPGM